MKLVIALMVLAVTANAVGVSHKGPARASFANTMLMEVKAHIQAGGPVEQLNDMLDTIEQRIADAEDADNKQHEIRLHNCETEQANFTLRIEVAEQEQDIRKANINKHEAEYNRIAALIPVVEKEIAAADAKIVNLTAEIKQGNDDRALEKEKFINRTKDTTSVIAAVEELRGVEAGSTLSEAFPDADDEHSAAMAADEASLDEVGKLDHANEVAAREKNDAAHEAGVDADKKVLNDLDVEAEEFGQHKEEEPASFMEVRSRLNKLAAAGYTDTRVAALLAVASSTSAKMMTESDYDKLLKLLKELSDELKAYTEQLIRTEKTSARDWARTELQLTQQLRSQQELKTQKQKERTAYFAAKKNEALAISTNRKEYNEQKEIEEVNEELLEDSKEKCSNWVSEKGTRDSERADERDTILEIRKLIREEMQAALQQNDAVNAVAEGVTAE